MQWYQHTKPAQMRLVLDECLEGSPLAQYEDDDETTREQYRCVACGEDTYWVIYDRRNPIAGCTNGECSVDPRMRILDVLEHHWPRGYVHELPESGTDRRKALQKKLNEISAHYLEEEERQRQEELQAERLRIDRMSADRDQWKQKAEGWQAKADRQKARAAGEAASRRKVEAELRRGVDKQALRRGAAWGTAAFCLACCVVVAFLARAGAEMLFAWTPLQSFVYVIVVASALGFLAFAVAHRDATTAKERNESPRAMYERLGWGVGLSWSLKIVAFLLVPYLLVGAFGRSAWFDSLLPRDGVEWLLVSTAVAVVCVLAMCASMAEDLE